MLCNNVGASDTISAHTDRICPNFLAGKHLIYMEKLWIHWPGNLNSFFQSSLPLRSVFPLSLLTAPAVPSQQKQVPNPADPTKVRDSAESSPWPCFHLAYKSLGDHRQSSWSNSPGSGAM